MSGAIPLLMTWAGTTFTSTVRNSQSRGLIRHNRQLILLRSTHTILAQTPRQPVVCAYHRTIRLFPKIPATHRLATQQRKAVGGTS